MHPILTRLDRLAAYLAAWCVVGAVLGAVLVRLGLGWAEALVLVLPPLFVYAFICLSAWYVCRALPLGTSGVPTVLGASMAAAAVAGAIWFALARGWVALLSSVPALEPLADRFDQQSPLLIAASVLLFLLVLSVHYVALAFESLRAAERQQLELQMLSRDAELRALRAQINPHFLYNSLNSISALTGSDPQAARRMCLLLADFLRTTLHMSTQDRIPLRDELALIDRFLSIEQVRFGDRLRVSRQIDDAAATVHVPPLLLQPLVENAIAHGIAGLVEGGVIDLEVRRHADRLSIDVRNPRDPDASLPRARGVGLENVRRRLAIAFGGLAHLDAHAGPGTFRVSLELPCAPE